MSDAIRNTIEELKRHVSELETQTTETKRTVNSLCRRIGEQAAYDESEMEKSSVANSLRGDEYFNKPLATAVRMILERRYLKNDGPAGLDELYDAMIAGGYEFDTKNVEIAKRGVAISLAKNTPMFVKLPSGKFGLAKQYGMGGRQRPASNGKPAAEDQPEVMADQPEEAEVSSETELEPAVVGGAEEAQQSTSNDKARSAKPRKPR